MSVTQTAAKLKRLCHAEAGAFEGQRGQRPNAVGQEVF